MGETPAIKTVYINTLGCPKNEVDSDILSAYLNGAGWNIVDSPEEAAAEIVNTCGFISQAKSESIEAVFEAVFRRKQQGGPVVVTGCLAQRYGKELCEQIPQADAIIGLQRPDLVVRVLNGEEKPVNGRICWIGSPEAQGDLNQTARLVPRSLHGYVKISDGCNNHCGYCIIPKIRGSLHSRSMENIEDEVRRFVDAGVREVILVAQDTAAFGNDNGQSSLQALIGRLDKIPGDFWLRLLYMHPMHLTDELIDTIAASKKTIPYLDLPLQHISDDVLRVMNRKVTRSIIEDRLARVRDRIDDVVIRTTFLLGHPGETEKCFNELIDFIQEFEFDRLAAFAYSPEAGTAVFNHPDTPTPGETDRRVERLLSMQETIVGRRSQRYVGQSLRCLLETPSDIYDDMWEGRTMADAPEIDGTIFVTTNGGQKPGFVDVTVEQADGYDLFGSVK